MFIYNLIHLLKNSAEKCPKQIAFRFLNEAISYEDLHKKTNQLAHQLIDKGVTKGTRVGIYTPRCLESVIAVYGILKAGGVYVPLDPFAPITRTEFVIKDCDIKYLISIPKQAKKISKFNKNINLTSIIGINTLSTTKTISWEKIYATSIVNFSQIEILEQDLAYILYTSGSTGTPKGIMHTHFSSLNFVKLAATTYGLNPNDIVGMHAPLHFDPSTFGLFSSVYAGATTIIVSDAHTKLPASLADLIKNEKITVWFSVPLALTQLLQKGAISEKQIDSIRWVLFSGEVFITKHLKALMKVWDKPRYSNIYGPTELNQCTYYHLDNPPISDDPIPIGYVWGNSEYKIIDKNDKVIEGTTQGELVVRSGTMMKGYWNNPELTKKSFFKVEIAVGVEEIYYRTGDQVKLNEKGELLFIGRNDRQIKIRGYRVEIDEIENTLTKNKAIEEAVVIVQTNSSNEKELSAALLISEDSDFEISEIKAYCKEHLPIYAIPSNFLILNEFPRTASEKINRKEIEKSILIHA